MGKLWNLDGPVTVVLGKIADLVILNLITMILCLPIITAGAALASMYHVLIQMARGEEGYILKGYFRFFKENWKKGILAGFLLEAFLLLTAVDFYAIGHGSWNIPAVVQVAAGIGGILVGLGMLYLIPVFSWFDSTFSQAVSNAYLISITSLPQTVLVFFVSLLPILLLKYYTWSLPVLFLLGISLPAYINSLVFSRVFKKLEVRKLNR